MVLRAVGQAVEEQVDAEQQQAPGRAGALGPGGRRLVLLARVQREDGDARRDGRDDQVLVQRVALAEERDVEEHDGEQLAALGEEEGDVVDVRQARVAERAGEAARDGDEGQRREDRPGGDDGRDGLALGRRGEEVHGADGGGEEGLDGVEEHGELPLLGGVDVSMRCCRELFLKIRPRQATCPSAHNPLLNNATRADLQRGVDPSNGNNELQHASLLLLLLNILLHRSAIGGMSVRSDTVGTLPRSRVLVEVLGRGLALHGGLLRSSHCDGRLD